LARRKIVLEQVEMYYGAGTIAHMTMTSHALSGLADSHSLKSMTSYQTSRQRCTIGCS